MDRAQVVHENFLRRVQAGDFPPPSSVAERALVSANRSRWVELFYAQAMSRQLDRMARHLQARGEGYYTIGSSGHEGSAAVAMAARPTDMAFLHYRDAAFQIARSRQVPGQTPLWDMLLSLATSVDDPISGGRHKVLGSKALAIPPQTSTIASHLPKAVGAAYSIGLNRRLRPEHRVLPDDAVVICSFGDASVNHSTAQGAINTAGWTAYQNVPLPIVFVCEDNGIGISVRTPHNWVAASVENRPGLKYMHCDGLNMVDVYRVASDAFEWSRAKRVPVFLHMSCVRLYGHAGADSQAAYMSQQQIEADEANDPLLHSARILVQEVGLSTAAVLDIYETIGQRAERAGEEVIKRPRLQCKEQVMASLTPPPRECAKASQITPDERAAIFGPSDLRAMNKPQPMAKLINLALHDLMLMHHEVVLAGEDIGRKGGVYGVTQKLLQRFGAARVIDTLLDEQSILGLAIGMGHNGLVAIPEIQFLAYLHNAEDQIRGEAATLPFFSNGQFTNPMVVRVAGLGYQRGFGGHFHNDNSLAVLRDLPGVIVACPSNGEDAVLMLRECVRLARENQRVVIFVEPIALYMTRDLHSKDDGLWARQYPAPTEQNRPIAVGEVATIGTGKDLAIITYANGCYLSCQAQKILRDLHGIECRVIDMRWLAPLPQEALIEASAACENVLIVDECRVSGSSSEALMALFAERSRQSLVRLAAQDSFIATGPAYAATMPGRDDIVEAARQMLDYNRNRNRDSA